VTFGDVVREVAGAAGVSQPDARAVLAAFFPQVVEAVRGKSRVVVPGFGVFSVQHRAARVGRNPKTGTRVDIPPRDVLHFKPSGVVEI